MEKASQEPVYDLVVVGLGLVGLATVYKASCEALSVLGLEQMGGVLHDLGSSHGESRLSRQAYSEGAMYVPMMLDAHREWDLLRDRAELHLPLLNRSGVLYVTNDVEDAVVRGAIESAKYGVPVELFGADGSRMTDQFPFLRGQKGEQALWEPGGGWVAADRAREAMHRLAVKQGAELRYRTRVMSWGVNAKDKDTTAVRLADGSTVIGRAVVIAGGPWAQDLVPGLKVTPLRRILAWYVLKNQEQGPAWAQGPGFLLQRRGILMYGFPAIEMSVNGRILWCVKAAMHYAPNLSNDGGPLQAACHPDTVDRTVHDGELNELDEAVCAFMPGLGERIRQVVCLYTNSADGHFVLDTIPHAGGGRVVVAAGLSGHGFKFGPTLGKICLDLALNRPSQFDLTPFRLQRGAEVYQPKSHL